MSNPTTPIATPVTPLVAMPTTTIKDLDHASVEGTRPAVYTAMKYWGKKPHNIWSEYISNYTPANGIYLDPFSGSATGALEAYRAGKKAIAFDLNPLTSFLIEVLTSEFNPELFKAELSKIFSDIEADPVYKANFYTNSRITPGTKDVVQHFKWDKGVLFQIGAIPPNKSSKYLAPPDIDDNFIASNLPNLKTTDLLKCTYPKDKVPVSAPAAFIKAIGGPDLSNIWTPRVLYVLSKIFEKITKNDMLEEVRKQLLFGFIQSLHLCSKMCVPRNPKSNRDWSTSWGRSAFICSSRQMEMNPLLKFRDSCLGKQSVESALEEAQSYFSISEKKPILLKIDKSNKASAKKSKNFDIKYGVVDINNLTDFIEDKSVDFILTDPPYGGLVQYLDLSTVWLSWLSQWDPTYKPDYASEITIKQGFDISTYQKRFTDGLKQIHTVLKDEGKIVITFHNKDIKIWNAFLKSISDAGFKIEKIIHQRNKRTGESNVANPYGTSANDFYIRCVKQQVVLNTDEGQFEHFIITNAINIIARRNEKTPYDFLFAGLLSQTSLAGFDISNFDKSIESILDANKGVGKIFNVTLAETALWWFNKPEDHIKYPDLPLEERVEKTTLAILLRKSSVSLDDVLAEIFIAYPNGLTPDVSSIVKVLNKLATKSGNKWKLKAEVKEDHTKHTDYLAKLAKIGKKLKYEIFIGKREQPEPYEGGTLSLLADHTDLSVLKITDKLAKARLEMIDMLWVSKDASGDYSIGLVIEVENSTNFTSGVQRASNTDKVIPKLMVIPDKRKNELEKTKDPLFIAGFNEYSWKYMEYSIIDILAKTKTSIDEFIDSPYVKSL